MSVKLQTHPRMLLWLGLFLAIALDTSVQLCWKASVPAHDGLWQTLLITLVQPLFLLSILLHVWQLFNWMMVLALADLSFAQPITALSYVTVAGSSIWLFGETVHPPGMVGIALVLLGVVLVSRSAIAEPGLKVAPAGGADLKVAPPRRHPRALAVAASAGGILAVLAAVAVLTLGAVNTATVDGAASMGGILAVLAAVGLETIGQVTMKIGTHDMPRGGLAIWRRILGNTWVQVGILAFVLEAVFWTWALQLLPLVVAFPMGSTCFVTVAVCSALLLHERISWLRWLGIFLIICGVVLIGSHGHPI